MTTSGSIFGLTGRPVPRWVAHLQFVVFVGIGQDCGRHGCSTYWVPATQFTAVNGRTVTFTGPQSGSPIDTGDQVQVSYDPGNPAVARDTSAGPGNAWMLIGFGALAILAGVASFLLGIALTGSMRRPR